VGIANLGNTCYANSTIQLLKAFPALSAFCLSEKGAHVANPESKEAKVWVGFRELLESLWSGHRPAFCRPRGFMAAIHEAVQDTPYDQFATRMPNDAHEYLVFLLDRFQTATGRPLAPAFDVEPQHVKAWHQAFAKDFSPIVSLFFGQVEKCVTCNGCNAVSRSYEVFNCLKVSPMDGNATLEQCLAQEFHDEKIDGYSCDACHNRTQARVSNRIQRLPPYLFTVVRRFEDMNRKDNRPVSLAEGNKLSLSDYTTDSCADARTPYNLLGVVDHHGSAFGGHYIAQIHHLGNGNWYLYDDETSHQIRGPSIGQSSYIMAWHRAL
jgi:ubiquitin C-terminal hydrolase